MAYHTIYCPDIKSCLPDPQDLPGLLDRLCNNSWWTCA